LKWQLAQDLVEVLAPFYTATKLLSVLSRQTFGDAFCILKQIKLYLETESSEENDSLDEGDEKSSWKAELSELKTDKYYEIVNYLKSRLLKAYNLYTKRHISKEMNEALLVLIFLS
jgi:hypothetical protein